MGKKVFNLSLTAGKKLMEENQSNTSAPGAAESARLLAI